ncbi:MAG: hypothetical protein JWL77_6438 [Chthonomonadaceae bacterium]|nr:hypothetical protein [Chthonomonadaceae bacterium]
MESEAPHKAALTATSFAHKDLFTQDPGPFMGLTNDRPLL